MADNIIINTNSTNNTKSDNFEVSKEVKFKYYWFGQNLCAWKITTKNYQTSYSGYTSSKEECVLNAEQAENVLVRKEKIKKGIDSGTINDYY